MNTLKSLGSTIQTNLRGKKISERVVVIESDDWGSIRIPSREAIIKLKYKGINLNKNVYTSFDGLETNSDLELLLDVLSKFKDLNGKHPIITSNFVTCNPEFNKIKESKFENYFNEKISLTYQNYPFSDKVLELVNSSVVDGLFLPQFHGREHVNVEYWMTLLKKNDPVFRLAFDESITGLGRDIVPQISKNIQATYDTLNTDYAFLSINEGLQYFEEIFGYKAKSFIPNNFVLNPTLLSPLKKSGVDVIQGMKYMLVPNDGKSPRRRIFRQNGFINEFDQVNIVRNCSYEPSESKQNYLSTLKEIKIAFLFNQPAVISSHRLNFTSRISTKNRDKNLRDFEQLIRSILKFWPDVSFLNTLQLSDIFRKKRSEK